MVTRGTIALLQELEGLKLSYGGDAAVRKVALMRALDRARFGRASALLRFHEVLCFMRAYPDGPELLAEAERILAVFANRRDLRRHRAALADSGVAGTTIYYSFYWPTAQWLAERWPEQLRIDWPTFENSERLVEELPLILPYTETLALDNYSAAPREWIELLKQPGETDGAFLVKRFEQMPGDAFTREKRYEDLDVPYTLKSGPETPNRTDARFAGSKLVFQRRPLRLERPELPKELRRAPLAVLDVKPREAEALIELARESMVTRARDLYSFKYSNPRDVRMIECGDGLQFACIGLVPERRLMLEAVYAFLMLKNGVPIGYVLVSSLFNSAEIAYNVFETFRGGESGYIYGRVLAAARHVFGADAFVIDPYQLGHENSEGLKSGAWWFYYKLGFRPHDREVLRIVDRELAAVRKNPRHRSDIPTLKRLAAAEVFYYTGRPRADVIGRLPLGEIGAAVSRYLAARFGAAREEGMRVCSREAMQLLGLKSLRGFDAHERQAWERWIPLVMALDGVSGWTVAEKRALAAVVKAKGGRHESDFVRLFDSHRKLRRAVARIT
ncbi:MAG: hypothetical protein ACKVX7_15595 [Planctomycetota bacterium]